MGTAPAFTSASSATVNAGSALTFSVTTTGYPAPSLAETGALPTGISFHSNGNGTATISGTSTVVGTSTLSIVATNATGSVTQTFTLTVKATVPKITSSGLELLLPGQKFTFTVTTSGYPAPTLSETGSLPAGLTFVANANGTATIAGTPSKAGIFTITVTASNSAGKATQSLSLFVL